MVQVLLCQVGSRVGMVLCIYIESSWFLVSQLGFHLITHFCTRKTPYSSSFCSPRIHLSQLLLLCHSSLVDFELDLLTGSSRWVYSEFVG